MIVTKFDSFSFSKIIMTHNDNINATSNNKKIGTANLREMEIVISDLDLFQDAEKSNPIEDNSIYKIECIGHGDIIDLHKHEYKVEVKSITYHEMEIKRNQSGYYTAQFLVDL
jgi:SHS2 domain-containing protein